VLQKRFFSGLESAAEKAKEDTEDRKFLEVLGKITSGIAPLIGNLIQDYCNNKRFEILEELMNDIVRRLKPFEAYITGEYFKTDDFLFTVLNIINLYLRERVSEKREGFKMLLVNNIITGGANVEKEEEYIHILNDMSRLEFLILKWFYSGEFQDWERKEPEREGKLERNIRMEVVRRNGLDIRDFDVAITRLHNKGFFEHEGFGADGHLWRLEIFQGMLNDMGKRFLNYINEYQKP